MAEYTTNYTVTPTWFTSDDSEENGGEDVIALAAGPHAVALNITCIPKTGSVQLQVRDENGDWFTPAPIIGHYTVTDSTLLTLPRANMPDVRILAVGDATFSITGSLRS